MHVTACYGSVVCLPVILFERCFCWWPCKQTRPATTQSLQLAPVLGGTLKSHSVYSSCSVRWGGCCLGFVK